jgi:hypothetical protein
MYPFACWFLLLAVFTIVPAAVNADLRVGIEKTISLAEMAEQA